ncbi:hypothetical protein ACQ4PT_007653 [Festuca glaucescens]
MDQTTLDYSLILPPPPPWYESTPTTAWYPPPPPPSDQREIIVFLVVTFAASLLGLFVCGFIKGLRHSRDRAEAAEAAAAAAPLRRSWPRALPQLEPTRHFQELRRLRQARAATPAACLPSFKYNLSVKRSVIGGGEEAAATCSVCLGAFQLGETVRLLPVCLHLYHVECIDLWLDAHSTCPICRSDTDPTMDVARLPPV